MNPSWAVTKLMLSERAPAVVGVEVGRAGEPEAEVAHADPLAGPERPDRVPVLAVPLRPQWRELADLVAALADVPGLGDELDPGDHRVLVHHVEERGQLVHVVERAGQRGGQVEPETVHVHLGDPVAQRVHQHLQHVRVAYVEGVAAAGVVDITPLVVGGQPVVAGVVDAAEAQRRPGLVALGGVVVDHVEDDLDAGGVQRPHHRLELAHLPARCGRVRGVRREVADGVVAPVVGQPAPGHRRLGDELLGRQQLHRGHPEPDQVLERGRVGQPRVRPAQRLGHARVPLGEAAHVQLVDDRVVPGRLRPGVVAPRERVVHHHRARHVRRGVLRLGAVRAGVPVHGRVRGEPAVDRSRVRVEQQLGRVVAQPVARPVGPVHAVAVAVAGADPGQVAVPDVVRRLGQWDARLGLALAGPALVTAVPTGEQAQLDRLRAGRPEREVRPLAVPGRAERQRLSGPRRGGVDRELVGTGHIGILPDAGAAGARVPRRDGWMSR